ncbi:hypothetical protein [Burkholderia multivorans]|uniref:hypothetical protein n=1 Tax=Burkholderia multivorans TaxID=87883 RepID=UPI0015897580|nr:hypothetical protein [Burkholderia multivorans]MDN8102621.1 hypothetical protein [Burkholderia multivorans]
MNDRQCPPNLTRDGNENIWTLAGKRANAADLLGALEYVWERSALFLIYRNEYLNVERLLSPEPRRVRT